MQEDSLLVAQNLSVARGCDASSWSIVSKTGFAVFCLLGAGAESSLMEQTEFSKPK